MIICKKCGYDNPMTTSFCRSCGERIEFDPNQLESAMVQNNAEKRDHDVMDWGRSALSLCGFAFAVALVVRFIAVPTPPPADLPALPDLALYDGTPEWASVESKGIKAGSLEDLAAIGGRLSWRAQQGTQTLSSLSLDFGSLTAAQDALLAEQQADGSFKGPNDIAATALGVLGLQAWPREVKHQQAAERGRTWLNTQWQRYSSTNPTAKALMVAALMDAEDLDDKRRNNLGVLIVDGTSPSWQSLSLAGYVSSQRPSNLVALTNKLTDDIWPAYLTMMQSGNVTAQPMKLWFSETANAQPTGEARIAWATLAWQYPRAPDELRETLRQWAVSNKPPVEAATLETAGGAVAYPAVQLMIAGAPIRLPPLQMAK